MAEKQCKREECKGARLRKRKTAPATATRDGMKWFDYYQCPRCKVNYAFGKGFDKA